MANKPSTASRATAGIRFSPLVAGPELRVHGFTTTAAQWFDRGELTPTGSGHLARESEVQHKNHSNCSGRGHN
jgi:hypothetical protein